MLGNKEYVERKWDQESHPDDEHGQKYKLVIEGLDRLLESYGANGMKSVYIWMDYCCLDQTVEDRSSLLLSQFDLFISSFDALFTPIYDPHIIHAFKYNGTTKYYLEKAMHGPIKNYFKEYPAALWNSGTEAYLARGWCRLEMCYAASVPTIRSDRATFDPRVALRGNDIIEPRIRKMSGKFQMAVSDARRPHLMYGSYESLARMPPYILPSFYNKYNFYLSYFQKYNPVEDEAYFYVEKDRQLVRKLLSYTEEHVIEMEESATKEALMDGFEGDYNEDGQFHGYGTFKYIESGNWYEGNWFNGKKEGDGKMKYGNGDIYEGEWKNDLMHGKGKMSYKDGDIFEGTFINGLKEGGGLYTFGNRDVLKSTFSEEKMHGK